jgi:hypothetical protein
MYLELCPGKSRRSAKPTEKHFSALTLKHAPQPVRPADPQSVRVEYIVNVLSAD